MPETKGYRKMKRAMQRHYGKKKGEQVFYAMRNKRKKSSRRRRK